MSPSQTIQIHFICQAQDAGSEIEAGLLASSWEVFWDKQVVVEEGMRTGADVSLVLGSDPGRS